MMSAKVNAVKQEYKSYLIAGLGFMLALYLLAFLFLALLTTINSAAGYPLYNFLGSEVDLEPVVLQLLPAQNPYHLQKWNSFPLMIFLLSTVFFVISLVVGWQFAKQIRAQGGIQLTVFLLLATGLAGLVYKALYSSIAAFIGSLLLA